MSVFSYRATTPDGTIVEGTIEAADEATAVDRLKNTGIIPLRVVTASVRTDRTYSFRSSHADLLTFTTELSALLGAGLPLDRSLNILSEISEGREMKSVIQSVLRSIREGSSFSDSLQRHPRVFPKLYINMVRAGELGGVLDVVLDKLNEFLESARELKEHVFSAMIYPAILLFTGGISIIILLVYVLPKFSTIFAEMGSSLPLPTVVLIKTSTMIKTYWWIILAAAVSGWIAFRNYIRSAAGRYRWDSLMLKLTGDVIIKLETARFTRTLGTLLKSGVPLLQALKNAKDIIGNRVVASAIDSVVQGAQEGKGIAGPLSGANVFPPLALSMIKVGEETGQLDIMLLKVAATYERSLRTAMKRFIGFLEPALILSMGLIIGFMVLAMLMGIFSMTEMPF